MEDDNTVDMTGLEDGYGYTGQLPYEPADPMDGLTDEQQELFDQQIVSGLSNGSLVISSPEDHQRLINNANARARVAASPYYTADQKEDVRRQTLADDARIRRGATPIPPEQRSSSLDAQRARLVGQLPPDLQDKPWQLDAKSGALQMPRGYKEPDPGDQTGEGGETPDDETVPVTAPAVDEGGDEMMPSPRVNQAPPAETIPTIGRDDYAGLPPGSWYIAKGHEDSGPQYKPISVRDHQQRRIRSMMSPDLYQQYGRYYTIDHSGNLHFHKELYDIEHPRPEKETPEARSERMQRAKEEAATKKEKHTAERKRIDRLRSLDFNEAKAANEEKPPEQRKSGVQLWREAEVKFPYLDEEPGEEPAKQPAQQQEPSKPGGSRPTLPTPKEFDTQWANLKPGESLVGPDGKIYRKRKAS